MADVEPLKVILKSLASCDLSDLTDALITKSVYPVCGIELKVTLDAPAAPTVIFSSKT
jgi:hypothetical protein